MPKHIALGVPIVEVPEGKFLKDDGTLAMPEGGEGSWGFYF